MTSLKRKLSVSLDPDLVEELEAGGEAVSAQVNDAVRTELVKRRRQRLLKEMLDDFERTNGPVDEALVSKYTDLLA